jgi:nucleotide-binding universal stress UspA family protein
MDPIITIEADPKVDLQHIQDAKEFMRRRCATKAASKAIPYKVEIVHYMTDADSIGDAVCKRAEALNAAMVVLTKHQRGALSEFFLGSTAIFVAKRCTMPVVLIH